MLKTPLDFVVGQRWLSDNEPELGLGLVISTDFRLVTLYFPESDAERTYAKQNAPLTRIILKPGKQVQTLNNQQYQIHSVTLAQGCAQYLVFSLDAPEHLIQLAESHLSGRFIAESVLERLQAKMTDSQGWFSIRVAALEARKQIENSPVRGLRGPRIGLIGHQLYIADQVAQRLAPRVLLADEVGLGKTIEAGLIIHQQLHTGRAARVLIMVPDALVHQWFVEMIRRFNLHFHIFDESRLAALMPAENALEEQEQLQTNAFLSEQLVICRTSFVAGLTETQFTALMQADFDLMVIDEAHHVIQHVPEQPNFSELDKRIWQLANNVAGLILLSATPEQLGQESHFARLQLLDPVRFQNFADFQVEQASYHALLKKIKISDEAALKLLDEKGTGRVFYRNTRKKIQGFPTRHLKAVPLTCPEHYLTEDKRTALMPELDLMEAHWCEIDTRARWLLDFLKQHRQEKVLVICHSQATALDLSHWLGYQKGLRVTAFHEGLDFIERDRSAAYFADTEDGAQALICSEIGSEGRNFQFAKQLVLFDLPKHPDVLEQRIGRLDRIGQGSDIYIHVPYFTAHAQAVLFRWYHEGMQAFTQTNPVGYSLYQAMQNRLVETIQEPDNTLKVDALVAETAAAYHRQSTQLAAGRDELLERHSYHEASAMALIQALEQAEQETPAEFLQLAFEHYGVDSERISEFAWVARPGHAMRGHFPHLPEEGVTLTFSREQALKRDDWQFITWEHPMVQASVEQALTGHRGKVTVSLLKNKQIPVGTCFVELFYHIPVVAPAALQIERYLPAQNWRFLLTLQGQDLAATVSHEQLNAQCIRANKETAQYILERQMPEFVKLLETHQQTFAQEIQPMLIEAQLAMRQKQQQEITRIQRLIMPVSEKSRSVQSSEALIQLQLQTEALEKLFEDLLETQGVELAAIRVLGVTH